MKIFVIADSKTYLAFALAGLQGIAVSSESEVPAILETLDSREFGLVLVTEHLAERNRGAVDIALLEPGRPLILEIPALSGPPVERVNPAERILSLMRK